MVSKLTDLDFLAARLKTILQCKGSGFPPGQGAKIPLATEQPSQRAAAVELERHNQRARAPKEGP